MVNTIELEDGEQLFLEIQEAASKPEIKRDWKQAHHQSEVDNKKARAQKDRGDAKDKDSH